MKNAISCYMALWRCAHVLLVLSVLCMKAVVLLYAANVVLVLTFDPPCSDEEALKAIEQLCLEAIRGRVFGNLCASLCDTLDIRYRFCSKKGGEKDVYFVSWHNFSSSSVVQLVMKNARYSEKLLSDFYSAETTLTDELEQRFLREINQYLNQHTTEKKVHNIRDVVQLFWTITKDSANKRKLNVLRNMHGLALHNEYMFSLLYPNNDAIPRLYGSCGLFYFMEQVPFTLNDVSPTWSFRTSVARKLLDLVYRLENSFHERLHVCDVKSDNFGIDNVFGEITILDADSIMINSVFEHKLAALHCVDDQDCSIGNCRGACNKNEGKCFPFRTNSNLQAICEEIFATSDANEHNGLLRESPTNVKRELQRLLQECIGTNLLRTGSQKIESKYIITQLKKILSENLTDD